MPHEDYCYALERENHALNEKYESLRQQLADSQKQVTLLRDALSAQGTDNDDAWILKETALAATADLDPPCSGLRGGDAVDVVRYFARSAFSSAARRSCSSWSFAT